MTEKDWEALGSLVKPKNEIGEFLESLKNSETGEYASFEEGFPTFQEAFKNRSDGRYSHGRAERSQDINRFLVEKFGLDIDPKKAKTEDAVLQYVESLKEGLKPEPLTKDKLLENEIVRQLINDASKQRELTEETAKSNPIVTKLMQNSYKEAEAKYQTLVDELRSTIKERDERETDIALTSAIQEWAQRNKIDFGTDDDVKRKNAINLLKLAAKSNSHGFKRDESGQLLPLDAKGNPVSNPTTGFPIPFDEYISGISPYEPHKHDPKQNSPQPKSGDQKAPQGGKYNFAQMDQGAVYNQYSELLGKGKVDDANKLLEAYDEYAAANSK